MGSHDVKRGPRTCDWCSNRAVYEHLHVTSPAEHACVEHWQGCPSCRYVGPDKYHDKAKEAQP